MAPRSAHEPPPLNLEARWWDRRLFWRDDTEAHACPAVLDITGRTRILLFGPRQELAAGRWRLTARFELNAEAGLYPYLLQFDDQVHLAEERFGPLGEGLYEVSVENGWPSPAKAELRLWLLMHAFHGELRFHGAVIGSGSANSRQQAPPGSARLADASVEARRRQAAGLRFHFGIPEKAWKTARRLRGSPV